MALVYLAFICAGVFFNHKLTKAKAPRMPIPIPLDKLDDKPTYMKDFYPDGSPRWEWRG